MPMDKINMPWDSSSSGFQTIPNEQSAVYENYDVQQTVGDEKLPKYGTGKPYRIFITGDITSDSN